MSDTMKNILAVGALFGAGAILFIAFPNLIPSGLLLTDSIMEQIDEFGSWY